MPRVQSVASLSSSRWSPIPTISPRGDENARHITSRFIEQDYTSFNQTSPVTLHVRSLSSGPVDIPIGRNQSPSGQFLGNITSPTPPETPAVLMDANVPVSSLPLRTRVDHHREARCPPSANDAALALADLRVLLKSHDSPIDSDDVLRTRLDHLNRFLAIYTSGKGWIEAANFTATIMGKGTGCSRRLRAWAKNFIHDRSALPYHHYENSGRDSLLDNVNFVEQLFAHITDTGAHVSAQAIIDFMKKPEVMRRYQIVKPISLDTACEWMSKLNFKWRKPPKGMYIDGHERPDVVHYRQNSYLPALAQYELTMRIWDEDNFTRLINPSSPSSIRHSVLWFNDQCIFYQNDRRKF